MNAVRVAILATPRVGNGWLRHLLATVYDAEQWPRATLDDVEWERLPERCILQMHWHHEPALVERIERYGFRVATMARHPLDVLISILHFALVDASTARWLGGEAGDERSIFGAMPRSRAFLDYVRGPRAAALLSVTPQWCNVSGALQVRYEKLLDGAERELERLVEAIGAPPRASIREAVERATIREMRRHFRDDHYYWIGQAGLWRQLLLADDVASFGPAVEHWLTTFGYDADADPRLDARAADARWVDVLRSSLAQDLHGLVTTKRELVELRGRLAVAEHALELARADAASSSPTVSAGPAVDFCTIVAKNYLPHARVLAKSLAEHHPESRFTALVVDATSRHENEGFDVLPADAVIDRAELHRMAMIYDVTELATALKPALLRRLRSHGASRLVYLDPDVEVFSRLDEAVQALRRHPIVLTPHTTAPMRQDGRSPTESDILRAGIFNLGFIGVGPGCEEFLDWWDERLRRGSFIDPDHMRFTDQRWVDFVPGYFRYLALRDPAFNVAYWNVDRRSVEWTGEHYEVDGRPLRFFHFSGFDPAEPWILSRHCGVQPRVLLSENPALARLCDEHARKLCAAGWAEADAGEYGYLRLSNGIALDRYMRRLYFRALECAEAGAGEPPPNPFDERGTASFFAWLQEPDPATNGRVSRYLMSIYDEHPAAQRAFPDVAGRDYDGFRDWCRDWRPQLKIPDVLMPPESPREEGLQVTVGAAAELRHGVTLAGYLRAELGIGQAARLFAAACEAADIPLATYCFDQTLSRQQHPFEDVPLGAPYDVNLIAINADQLPRFARHAGPGFFANRYNVGLWFWEVEKFPASVRSAFEWVDEVWVASEFSAAAIREVSPKPVVVVPPPIVAPDRDPALGRRDLGLPDDRFVFLFTFDFLSVFERKNPLAVVEAFCRAFRDGEGPLLVLKTINGDFRRVDLERLRMACARRRDILVHTEYLPREKNLALFAASDCYVSLHRSEGFGLTIAEAMALGRPVIATGYSGNMTFMDDSNAYLVDHTLVAVPVGCEPYPPDARWAEPDVEQAAALLRRVLEHPDEARAKAEKAAQDIRTRHSPAVRGAAMRERLGEIRHQREAIVAAAPRELSEPTESVAHPIATSNGIPASAHAALDMLEQGLDPLLEVSSRFGIVGRFARRLLFRLLRPFTANERALDRLLLESSLESATVQRAEMHEQERRIQSRIERLEGDLRRLLRNGGSRH
jgi:glycosyltransferase involved in cell wall biosynthesis